MPNGESFSVLAFGIWHLPSMLGHMSGVSAAVYTHRHPFGGARVSSYRITPPGAPKDTQHHVVSLAGSGIVYQPGDALGVCPRNLEPLVDAILQRLGATGDEMVTAGHAGSIPF